MPATVRVEPWDVRNRLQELGVPLVTLQKALQQAHLERNLCTSNDPSFIPGMMAWRFAVRTLRDDLLLLPGGHWRKDDPSNYALVINDTTKINICVASADEDVGLPNGNPRFTSAKGLYMNAAVQRNNYTEDMFPETLPEKVKRAAITLEYPTWILLIYTTADQARGELSFPESFDDDGVNAWKERIIIPDINIDPMRIDDDDQDSGPDFDIDVRLKT